MTLQLDQHWHHAAIQTRSDTVHFQTIPESGFPLFYYEPHSLATFLKNIGWDDFFAQKLGWFLLRCQYLCKVVHRSSRACGKKWAKSCESHYANLRESNLFIRSRILFPFIIL